jgi:hypothetical protein
MPPSIMSSPPTSCLQSPGQNPRPVLPGRRLRPSERQVRCAWWGGVVRQQKKTWGPAVGPSSVATQQHVEHACISKAGQPQCRQVARTVTGGARQVQPPCSCSCWRWAGVLVGMHINMVAHALHTWRVLCHSRSAWSGARQRGTTAAAHTCPHQEQSRPQAAADAVSSCASHPVGSAKPPGLGWHLLMF